MSLRNPVTYALVFIATCWLTLSNTNNLFAQGFNKKDLPSQPYLAIDLSDGSQLQFKVSANNYKERITLNNAAELQVKSNEPWQVYWSSGNYTHFEQEGSGMSNIPVSVLSGKVNSYTGYYQLNTKEQRLLNAIATMPKGEGGNNSYAYVCHNPGRYQQSLRIQQENLKKHLNHGDYEGLCQGDGFEDAMSEEEYEAERDDDDDDGGDDDDDDHGDDDDDGGGDSDDDDDDGGDDDDDDDDQPYQYDQLCYDNTYGRYMPCRVFNLSYRLDLGNRFPNPGRYRTEIIYTITVQ